MNNKNSNSSNEAINELVKQMIPAAQEAVSLRVVFNPLAFYRSGTWRKMVNSFGAPVMEHQGTGQAEVEAFTKEVTDRLMEEVRNEVETLEDSFCADHEDELAQELTGFMVGEGFVEAVEEVFVRELATVMHASSGESMEEAAHECHRMETRRLLESLLIVCPSCETETSAYVKAEEGKYQAVKDCPSCGEPLPMEEQKAS